MLWKIRFVLFLIISFICTSIRISINFFIYIYIYRPSVRYFAVCLLGLIKTIPFQKLVHAGTCIQIISMFKNVVNNGHWLMPWCHFKFVVYKSCKIYPRFVKWTIIQPDFLRCFFLGNKYISTFMYFLLAYIILKPIPVILRVKKDWSEFCKLLIWLYNTILVSNFEKKKNGILIQIWQINIQICSIYIWDQKYFMKVSYFLWNLNVSYSL